MSLGAEVPVDRSRLRLPDPMTSLWASCGCNRARMPSARSPYPRLSRTATSKGKGARRMYLTSSPRCTARSWRSSRASSIRTPGRSLLSREVAGPAEGLDAALLSGVCWVPGEDEKRPSSSCSSKHGEQRLRSYVPSPTMNPHTWPPDTVCCRRLPHLPGTIDAYGGRGSSTRAAW